MILHKSHLLTVRPLKLWYLQDRCLVVLRGMVAETTALSQHFPDKYTLDIAETNDEDNKNGEGKKLRTAALAVSWTSVIFSFCTGVAAIVIGQHLDSESLFGYGLDGVLDSLSSVAVLWRFYGSTSSKTAETRERRACIVISLFFFASAFSLTFKSAKSIVDNSRHEEGYVLIDAFSSCCGVVSLVLASIKVYVGRRLSSRSLMTDSIITYVGAAMSFLGVLGLELYRTDERVWYLDAVFGICCGVFLLVFGIKLLVEMTCCFHRNQPVLEVAQG